MCIKCTHLANSISDTVNEIAEAERSLRKYRDQLGKMSCGLKHPERRQYHLNYYAQNRAKKITAALDRYYANRP